MSKVQTSLRLDEVTLKEAKIILNSLGLNFTEAVNIFTNMVVQHKGLPFDVKIPNAETIQAMKEAEQGEGETISLDEFLAESKPHA